MSRTDRFDPRCLELILRSEPGLARDADLFVAYSGGLDSTVLLHALLQIGSNSGGQIIALHVDHGLNEAAGRWEQHCRDQCASWGAGFVSHRLDALERGGRGTEAAARDARYGWLSGQMTEGSALLTAHHLDDQVETVLAGLFRGSGAAGLAGIRYSRPFGKGRLLRPLLSFRRAALARYAEAHALQWIEDPMNSESSFTRNHIRRRVLPAVREKWPGADEVIARAAQNLRDAGELLDEVAGADLATVVQHRTADSHQLSVADLRRLGRLRLANALRLWFVRCGFGAPSRRHLEEVVDRLVLGAPAPTFVVRWPGTEVRRYRDRLFLSSVVRQPALEETIWSADRSEPVVFDGRKLVAAVVEGDGIRKSICDSGPVLIRPRRGGERCRLPGGDCRKKLKKIFQEKSVPPWRRADYPLLYVGEELAGVAGLCYCEPYAAAKGEVGVVFELVRDDSDRKSTKF